ncbi:MAG: hypothetical protein L6R39_007213 [Caloplaca ligustica]|nr:MAG: hypothetical protein L6R39_007213 [Caloplaca ligustica]
MFMKLLSRIRPFGLTANNTGLHLRIPDVEGLDRRKALIFPTADPDTVLDFLQLDKDTYSRSFDTVTAMFEFACTNRFFRPGAYVKHDLKANDRKHMASRALYRRFVDDFVPTKAATVQEEEHAEKLTKEKVLQEALGRFEKRSEFWCHPEGRSHEGVAL